MKNLVTLSKNSMFILSGIVCLILAWMTGTGDILNYIDFADPLNEMGFFMALGTMGIMLIYCGFAKS
jgi:hypothetical protein